jgi:hypothetical protein
MRLFATVVGVFVSTSAMAEATITYPISIPQECVELAQREGVPVVITSRYQGAKARVKLARLSDKDPLVRECRAAIDRMKKSAEYAQTQSVPSAAHPQAVPSYQTQAAPSAAAPGARDITAPQ